MRSTRSIAWEDLVELAKPRITLMVVITVAAGAHLAAPETFSPLALLGTLIASGVLASAASALNQVLESDSDALMARTADRPIAAGRLEAMPVLVVSLAASLFSVSYLAVRVNTLTALLGALTWALYLFAYTPMKRRSPLSTWIGAVPGALPPVMGWTAATGSLTAEAWIPFGILFLWQIPHFLAIAWMYRDEYEQAGIKVLPVVEPKGTWSAVLSVVFVLATLAVSLAPVWIGDAGLVYLAVASLLGLAFAATTIRFAARRTRTSARWVLLASVLYLPAVLAAMAIIRLPGA